MTGFTICIFLVLQTLAPYMTHGLEHFLNSHFTGRNYHMLQNDKKVVWSNPDCTIISKYTPLGARLRRLMGCCFHTGPSSPLRHTFHLEPLQTAQGSDLHTLLMPLQWLIKQKSRRKQRWWNPKGICHMAVQEVQQIYERMQSGRTKVCWVVIGRTIKAQSLQVGDEVRDCAFIDTLTLTENVKLWMNTVIQSEWPFSVELTNSLPFLF